MRRTNTTIAGGELYSIAIDVNETQLAAGGAAVVGDALGVRAAASDGQRRRILFRFPAKTANSVFIAHGTAKGRIALKTDGVRLYVVVEGEPRGEYLLRCFREGLDKKLIRPNMRTLVDMRRLVGGADWSAVFTLRTYAP